MVLSLTCAAGPSEGEETRKYQSQTGCQQDTSDPPSTSRDKLRCSQGTNPPREGAWVAWDQIDHVWATPSQQRFENSSYYRPEYAQLLALSPRPPWQLTMFLTPIKRPFFTSSTQVFENINHLNASENWLEMLIQNSIERDISDKNKCLSVLISDLPWRSQSMKIHTH